MQFEHDLEQTVHQLYLSSDWAGLVRLSIICGPVRNEALAAAISVAKETQFDDLGQRYWLEQQLESFRVNQQVNSINYSSWTLEEKATLRILQELPRAIGGLNARFASPEMQGGLLHTGQEAIQICARLSRDIHDFALEATFVAIAGDLFSIAGNTKSAANRYKMALELQEKAFATSSEILTNNALTVTGNWLACQLILNPSSDFSNEFARQQETYEVLIQRRTELRIIYAKWLCNFGTQLLNLEKFERAIELHEKAVKIAQAGDQGNLHEFAFILSQCGNSFFHVGKIVSAREAFVKAEAIYERAIASNPEIFNVTAFDRSVALMNQCQTLLATGEIGKALNKLQNAIELQKSLFQHNPAFFGRWIAKLLVLKSEIHCVYLQQFQEATNVARSAIELLKSANDEGIQVSPQEFAVAYFALAAGVEGSGEPFAAFQIIKKLEGWFGLTLDAPGMQRVAVHLHDKLVELAAQTKQQVTFEEITSLHQKYEVRIEAQRSDVFSERAFASFVNYAKFNLEHSELLTARQYADKAQAEWGKKESAEWTLSNYQRINLLTSFGHIWFELFQNDGDLDSLRHAESWFVRGQESGEYCYSKTDFERANFSIQGILVANTELLLATKIEMFKQFGDCRYLKDAFEIAEMNRCRKLQEILKDEELEPIGVNEEEVEKFKQLRKHFVQAAKIMEYGNVNTQLKASDEITARTLTPAKANKATEEVNQKAFELKVAELRLAAEEYENCLNEIQRIDPEFDPDLPLKPTTVDDFRDALPDSSTAGIQLTVTKRSSFAIVVSKQDIRLIEFKNLQNANVLEIVQDWFEKQGTRPRVFNDYLKKTLQKISASIVIPLLDVIPANATNLIVAANRMLHGIPIHACSINEAEVLCDRYQVTFSPSLSTYVKCRKRTEGERVQPHVVVADTSQFDLRFREAELHLVNNVFSQSATIVNSREEALLALQGATVFHFSGHAKFDFNEPLNSTLQCNSGDLLSLHDVYYQLQFRNAELVVLSACQSGMQRHNLMDEFDEFPTGFLYAGSNCVICSLWKVHDLPAMLLVDRFYSNWRAGLSIATALEMARKWLRGVPDHEQLCLSNGRELDQYVTSRRILSSIKDPELKSDCKIILERRTKLHTCPFASPVDWAAFIAVGVA